MKQIEMRVPELGESVQEAVIAEWLKKPGDAIMLDEPLVSLETDKVTLEIPAPVSGKLVKIESPQGAHVRPGALLGLIEEGAVSAQPAPAPAAPPAPEAKQDDARAPMLSPAARKLAGDRALDAASLKGSGKEGRVLKEDIPATAPAASPAPAPIAPPPASVAAAALTPREGEERVKMTPLRQTIAKRLKQAQNEAAMLTTFNEIEMEHVLALRREQGEAFQAKHGVKLGMMGFFLKATARALYEVPEVNARIEGDEIVYHPFCHIGVAVGTARGLIVPVLRHVEAMGFADIEKAIAAHAAAARAGRIALEDLQGGTFTISNGGIYGSLLSTPILNPPQSGVLGMHKIEPRAVVRQGEVVVRQMMSVALTYDHRLIDGQQAVRFLVRVKELVESPARLLFEL